MVNPGEPLWLSSDAESVLEYLRERSLVCVGCGLPKEETMNPKADGAYVSRGFRCHGCAARERARENFDKQSPNQDQGMYWSVEKRPPPK